MDFNSKIAAKIKEFRIARNIQQLALAKDLEMSNSSFSRLENGEIQITVNMLEKLSKALDVTLVELLDLKNTKVTSFNNNHIAQSDGGVINISFPVEELKKVFSDILDKR